jgi:epoxyqueuosine reductase QueG
MTDMTFDAADHTAVNEQAAQELEDYACGLGALLYGVASVDMYRDQFPDKPQPDQFVPGARSIVLVGMPFTQGVMETVVKHELSGLQASSRDVLQSGRAPVRGAERFFLTVENDMLDHEITLMAYKVARFIEGKGHRAMYLPTSKKSDRRFWTAPFYHMPAMYLAGLGTLGLNACIVTPEFGPGVWVTSIITDLELPAGQPLEEEACTHCRLCVENCPVNALDGEGWKDVYRCPTYGCCGTCVAVCPVGRP